MVDGSMLGLPVGSDDEDTSGVDFLRDDYEDDAGSPDDETAVRTTIGDEDEDDQDEGPLASPEETIETEGPSEETETPEETEIEETSEPEQLYAGRYASLDAFQRGYKDLQGGFTRVAQENKALVAELERQKAEHQQLREVVLQSLMESDPELAERLQAEEAFDKRLDEAIAERLGPISQQISQQASQQQNQAFLAEATQTILSFQSEHEIAQGDDTDMAMREAMEALVGAGVPLSPANREHLELVYEALDNRNLLFEIANARPEIFRVPGGTDFLRQRAGATITSAGSPSPGTQPKPRGAVRRRVEAHVETSSGTPASEAAPAKDEFDEAVDWYQKRFQKGPLFGSAR
jgi:hypothetical protein